jgi:excisionase family DNA binding protein
MSSKEAASYLGLNLRTLYRLIGEGSLPAYKFGRVIRLKVDDLEQFVEAARIVPDGGAGTSHLAPARSATR